MIAEYFGPLALSKQAVQVPDVFLVEDCQVLGHPDLAVLVYDVGLLFGESVYGIEPELLLVLNQDVLGVADLAGEVVLHAGPGVGGPLQN